MKALYELKDMVCTELEKSAKKEKISSTAELDLIDKLTHSLKSIETIIAMQEAQNGGYSEYGYSGGDGYSEARGRGRYARRDSMGRYSNDGASYDTRNHDGGSYRDGGYSERNYTRDGNAPYGDGTAYRSGMYSNTGDMMDKMRRMMDQASSEEERRAIKKIMGEMEK